MLTTYVMVFWASYHCGEMDKDMLKKESMLL